MKVRHRVSYPPPRAGFPPHVDRCPTVEFEVDIICEVADQEDSSAMTRKTVLTHQGICKLARLEARSFIFDGDEQSAILLQHH